eukprot:5552081-Lingulodinium_polyedra.AAC.1
MGSSQMGLRCIGSASSPPGFGRSRPSGRRSGQAPASSTASRTAQRNSRTSSGNSDSSPAYRPSMPGFFLRPIFRKIARSRGAVHGVRAPKAGSSSNGRSQSS